MSKWELLIEQLRTTEPYSRFDTLQDIIAYVSSTKLNQEQAADLLNSTVNLLQESNQKIPQFALEILARGVENSPKAFENYVNQVVEQAKSKLGDAKPQIKCAAIDLIFCAIQISSFQEVFDKLQNLVNNRNFKVRLSIVQIVRKTTETFKLSREDFTQNGSDKGPGVELLQVLLDYLNDSYPLVREEALNILVELYNKYGNTIQDYISNSNIRQSMLRDILFKFQSFKQDTEYEHENKIQVNIIQREMNQSRQGDKKTAPQKIQQSKFGNYHQQQEEQQQQTNNLREKDIINQKHKQQSKDLTSNVIPHSNGLRWATDETSQVSFKSERDIIEFFQQINNNLDTAKDWEIRIQALLNLEKFTNRDNLDLSLYSEGLKVIRDNLIKNIIDRRSQVSKQSSHTLRAISEKLGTRFEPVAQFIIPELMKNLQISIISESANRCLKDIYTFCEAPRLVSKVVDSLLTSKSSKLRIFCIDYLLTILENWDKDSLEKAQKLLDQGIQSSLIDASNEGRELGRKCLLVYSRLFPQDAYKLVKQFDPQTQQKLNKYLSTNGRGSENIQNVDNVQKAGYGQSALTRSRTEKPSERNINTELLARNKSAHDDQRCKKILASLQDSKYESKNKRDFDSHNVEAIELSSSDGNAMSENSQGSPGLKNQLNRILYDHRTQTPEEKPPSKPVQGHKNGAKVLSQPQQFPPQQIKQRQLVRQLVKSNSHNVNEKKNHTFTSQTPVVAGKVGSQTQVYNKAYSNTKGLSPTKSGIKNLANRGKNEDLKYNMALNGNKSDYVQHAVRRVPLETHQEIEKNIAEEQLQKERRDNLTHIFKDQALTKDGRPVRVEQLSREELASLHAQIYNKGNQTFKVQNMNELREATKRKLGGNRSPQMQQQRSNELGSQTALQGGASLQEPGATPRKLVQKLNGYPSSIKMWNQRVEFMQIVRDLSSSENPKMNQAIDQYKDHIAHVILDLIDDPHVKNQHNVLDLFANRILLSLFSRAVDSKESIKQKAQQALNECRKVFEPNAVLVNMAHALRQLKTAKSKGYILDFFQAYYYNYVTRNEIQKDNATLFVQEVCILCTDKALDLRTLALDCIDQVCQGCESGLAYIYEALQELKNQRQVKEIMTNIGAQNPDIKVLLANYKVMEPSNSNNPSNYSSSLKEDDQSLQDDQINKLDRLQNAQQITDVDSQKEKTQQYEVEYNCSDQDMTQTHSMDEELQNSQNLNPTQSSGVDPLDHDLDRSLEAMRSDQQQDQQYQLQSDCDKLDTDRTNYEDVDVELQNMNNQNMTEDMDRDNVLTPRDDNQMKVTPQKDTYTNRLDQSSEDKSHGKENQSIAQGNQIHTIKHTPLNMQKNNSHQKEAYNSQKDRYFDAVNNQSQIQSIPKSKLDVESDDRDYQIKDIKVTDIQAALYTTLNHISSHYNSSDNHIKKLSKAIPKIPPEIISNVFQQIVTVLLKICKHQQSVSEMTLASAIDCLRCLVVSHGSQIDEYCFVHIFKTLYSLITQSSSNNTPIVQTYAEEAFQKLLQNFDQQRGMELLIDVYNQECKPIIAQAHMQNSQNSLEIDFQIVQQAKRKQTILIDGLECAMHQLNVQILDHSVSKYFEILYQGIQSQEGSIRMKSYKLVAFVWNKLGDKFTPNLKNLSILEITLLQAICDQAYGVKQTWTPSEKYHKLLDSHTL